MTPDDYRKASDEARKAWFAYKASAPNGANLSLTSFIAGWNAANNLSIKSVPGYGDY